jgi:hypothetical protein
MAKPTPNSKEGLKAFIKELGLNHPFLWKGDNFTKRHKILLSRDHQGLKDQLAKYGYFDFETNMRIRFHISSVSPTKPAEKKKDVDAKPAPKKPAPKKPAPKKPAIKKEKGPPKIKSNKMRFQPARLPDGSLWEGKDDIEVKGRKFFRATPGAKKSFLGESWSEDEDGKDAVYDDDMNYVAVYDDEEISFHLTMALPEELWAKEFKLKKP